MNTEWKRQLQDRAAHAFGAARTTKRASDKQPHANVAPEHRPVHHVTVADCYPTSF